MKKIKFTSIVIIIFLIGFTLGTYKESFAYVKKFSSSEKASLETFWKVWNILDEQFVETKHKDKFGQYSTSTATSTDLDSELSREDKRIYGAIKGMVDSEGDPYTNFFTPSETKSFETEIAGSFEGVGMEVGKKDDIITVIAPLPDSPSEKAGVKSGDKVITIDDISTADMTVEKAVSLIRGKGGTTVKLGIIRTNATSTLEIKIVRDTIELPTLKKSYDKNTGVYTIKVYSFTEKVNNMFVTAIDDMMATGSKKLVLDLRGNPGGYLESAVYMASFFIEKGKVALTQDYGKKRPTDISYSKGFSNLSKDVKVAVLVDGGSASASEIVAGALRDYKKATIIGSKTFGKGSVQEYIKVTPKLGLKVTIARWLTPNGHSISVEGLTPDIEVSQNEEDTKNKKDTVYEKAVEILSK